MSEQANVSSGREKALARRRSMIQGKASAGTAPAAAAPSQKPGAVSSSTTQVSRAKATSTPPTVDPNGSGREASKARRDALIKGKARSQTSQGGQPLEADNMQATWHPKAKAKAMAKQAEETLQTQQAEAASDASSAKPDLGAMRPSQRKESRQKRVATKPDAAQQPQGRLMSKAHRQACAKGKNSEQAFRNKSGHSASKARMANPDASSREIAKQVRAERCTKGKTACKASPKPRSEQPMKSSVAPSKVGQSQTGAGQTMTGTQTGKTDSVTGMDSGYCQKVSGTEYLGTEEFGQYCATDYSAAPSKVSRSQTTRGLSISGTAMGQDKDVTGNESGVCAGVTGTDYLPADQSDLFCNGGGAARAQAPQKVTQSTTAKGTSLTGVNVSSVKPREDDRARPTVTGEETGYCANVTGTGYQDSGSVREVCQMEPPAAANKVMYGQTGKGQSVSGDRAGSTAQTTGSEAGQCSTVTGTPYMDALQTRKVCSTDEQTQMAQRQPERSPFGGHAVSGIQPGVSGVTGGQKGACQTVSGTAYQGHDQTVAQCDVNAVAEPGDPDFPTVMQPQAVAVGSEPAGSGQITGAFSSAKGKVTGDNENSSSRTIRPKRTPSQAPAAQSAASGVTGEGSDQGFSITGDGWGRGPRMSGTEGHWSNNRNASIRGDQSQAFNHAADYRKTMGPEVENSPITGSSGNFESGATVTLSGGARA
ncbi:CsoS2 family carboxysome shell protein [Hydrogenovibrio halophilus]|uniref:CsoS2 family carboxysome shell protein n=1 Tax=Hydrogenovibrio halophilus TaxID=373391 RepID=UPI00036AA06B|nr:CsoS2 family carboxysome shell protein [Hydrogenovibrio halophilus]